MCWLLTVVFCSVSTYLDTGAAQVVFQFLLTFLVAFEFKASCPLLAPRFNLWYRTSKWLVKLASIEELNSQIDTSLVLSAAFARIFVLCSVYYYDWGCCFCHCVSIWSVWLVTRWRTRNSATFDSILCKVPLHFFWRERGSWFECVKSPMESEILEFAQRVCLKLNKRVSF